MQSFQQFRTIAAQPGRECGSMLIELMISIAVLVIGLGGLLVLLVSSVFTNNRSGKDTSSTMVAEHVLEQISAQQANSTAPLTFTDCAGTLWNVSTAAAAVGGGSGGSYGGNGASLTGNATVDWSQSYANVPAGYAMKYADCGNGSVQVTYDVRWDVITMTAYSRMIIVSARPLTSVGGLQYVVPANLRTIGGM